MNGVRTNILNRKTKRILFLAVICGMGFIVYKTVLTPHVPDMQQRLFRDFMTPWPYITISHQDKSTHTSTTLPTAKLQESMTATLVDSTGPCPKLSIPQNVVDTQTFQYIGSKMESKVYSSFRTLYVEKAKTIFEIRILGYVDINAPYIAMFCQIWIKGDKLRVVDAKRVVMIESHGMRFGAVWFICPISGDLSPYAVSLVTKSCDNPLNVLPVIDSTAPPSGKFERNFTTCVAPFIYKYNKSYELIEKFELDLMFGADVFVFYNHSMGPSTGIILEYYSNASLVNIIQWPIDPRLVIHYFGQVVAVNDCVYRYAGRSRYIGVTDLDEIIVPLKHENWLSLLRDLDQSKKQKINTFIFRCSTFRKEWANDPGNFSGQSEAVKYQIMSLLKFSREPSPRAYPDRPKTILDPRSVDSMGIHEPHKNKPGAVSLQVPIDIGLLFHYRNQGNDKDKNRKRDTFLLKYSSIILSRISGVWKDLEKRIALPADCNC